MLNIHSTEIEEVHAKSNGLNCSMVDLLSVESMKISEDYNGCPFTPQYALAFQAAEDMVIPRFLCGIHYRAFKLAIKQGVAISQELID